MLSEMAPIGIGLIFVVFVALAIVGAIYAAKAAKERRAALLQLAGEYGFGFDPDDDAVRPELERFGTFTTGDKRRTYNTLAGALTVIGRPVAVRTGDYRYTTTSGTGKDRHETTTRLSYLYARLPFTYLGTLAVRRENFVDRIAGAIGFEDINFESAEFSRRFHVKSDNRKLAYDLFDPRMIEWYMAIDAPKLEIAGNDLLLLEDGTWKPEEFRAKLEWLKAFIEHWPTHVIDRLDSPPTPR